MDRRSCPKCLLRMEEQPLGGVRVDVCPGCGGTWFDRNELALARSQKSRASRPVPTVAVPTGEVSTAACPACSGELRVVEVNGTPFERCETCKGFFLTGEQIESLGKQWRAKARANRRRAEARKRERRLRVLLALALVR